MTTVSQYSAQRATAGTRYQNAVAELHDAYVQLAALDAVLDNKRAGGLGIPTQTFKGDVDQRLPEILKHPVYLPAGFNNPRWTDEVRQQLDAYLAALT